MSSSLSRGQAIRGVRPIIDGGTGSGVAATGLANLGGVATADHPSLHADDSIIFDGAFAVFDSTSGTRAAVQAAYDAGVRCVFLRPGTYNWDTTALEVPQGGQLRGLGNGLDDITPSGSYTIIINFSGSGTKGIQFDGGGLMENIYIDATSRTVTSNGSSAAAIFQLSFSAGYLRINNVMVENWATNQITQFAPAFSIQYGAIRDCRSYGSSCGFYSSAPAGVNYLWTVFENCENENSVNANVSQGGFQMGGGKYRAINCFSRSSGNAGFYDNSGSGDWYYNGCRAEDNAGDGFDIIVSSNNAIRNIMFNCMAFDNTGVGIRFIASGTNGSALGACWAGGNTGGNYVTTNVNTADLNASF